MLLWESLSNFSSPELQGEKRRPQPAEDQERVVSQLRQKQKLLSSSEVAGLIRRYEAGGTAKGLARDFGVHPSTAREYLKQAGVTRPRREALTKDEVAEAVGLYESGLSISQVAAKFDRKYQTMRQALLRAGVRMRPPGR